MPLLRVRTICVLLLFLPLTTPCSLLFTTLRTTPASLAHANALQSLRGPDATTLTRVNNHTYLHNLLHMSGATPTTQPYTNNVDKYALYNGEIYNSADYLPPNNPSSDGTALLPAYNRHGPTFPQHLDGEFALLLVDYANDLIVLATDAFGTKPLHVAVVGRDVVVASYKSAVERTLKSHYLPATNITSVPPNTILTYRLSTLALLSSTPTHTFTLTQTTTTLVPFTTALHAAISKRTAHLLTTPFIGLSSGYDSGTIACLLADHGIPTHALTIAGAEDPAIVAARVAYMASRDSLLSNTTYSWSSAGSDQAYKAMHGEVLSITEPSYYPLGLSYSSTNDDATPRDMRGDSGALGLAKICGLAQARGSRVYISGTGADEIYSDYGFNGVKYAPQSHFGGLFPDNLEDVFPWKNFYEGSQRAYLMKEELIAGAYGIEARYPFLDVAVVQAFLDLTPELKNQEYKSAIGHVLRTLNCPYDKGRKVGFSASDGKPLAPSTPPSRPVSLSPLYCPPPSMDVKGMVTYGLESVRSIPATTNMLRRLNADYPKCIDTRAALATMLLANDINPSEVDEVYEQAITLTPGLEDKIKMLAMIGSSHFNHQNIAKNLQYYNRAAALSLQSPPGTPTPPALTDMYTVYSTNFISNSPVFYEIRYADYRAKLRAKPNEVRDAMAFLQKTLDDPTPAPPTITELNAYALASLQHEASPSSSLSSTTLKKYIFEAPLSPQPLPSPKMSHFQFQSGGIVPLRIATVGTNPKEELMHLLHTAEKAQVKVDVLGLGAKWEGTHTKMELYYEYVKRLHPEQMVMTIDAYDVILSPELLSLTKRLPEDYITFNGEVSNWPDFSIGGLYPEGGTLPFLNSGVFVGKAKLVLAMLEEVLTYPALFDDQRAFVRYYLQNQDIVRVDTEGEVFYTMHAMTGGIVYDYDGFVSRPGGIKEGTKYQRPLVLHGNAVDGKELFAAIMKTIRGENDRLINYKTSEELFSLERNGGDGNVVRHQAMRMMDFMAETGGGLVSESWWAIATVANTLNKHGCYTAAIKLVFAMWRAAVVAGDEDLADIAIKTYASWFMGEGCGFCKVPPLRDSLEAFTLIDVLKSWAIGEDAGGFAYERYNMRALTAKDRSKWEEVSMYNLGIAHWWAGDVQECELAYRRLLAREVPPVAQLQPPQSPPELVDLKIAAVASEDRKELGYLLKTAEYAGMQIDVLGMNDEYGDNAQKMRYFNEYVANLHEDQLVMFVDAYDILVFEGVKELSKKWKEGALCGGEGGFASIVFSAEKSSYPDLGLKGVYGESTSIFTYLNSGAFIGPAGKLRRMLREVSEYPALYISDQRSFVRYYLRNRGEGGDICLDTEGKAFFSLHSVVGECVVRKGGRFENGGSEAAIVHGNAGGEGGKKYYKALFDAVEEVRGEGGKDVVVSPPNFGLAVALYYKGDLKGSKDAFLRHLQANADDAKSLYNLGVISTETGEGGEAEMWYRKCLEAVGRVGDEDKQGDGCRVNLAAGLVAGGGAGGVEEAVAILRGVQRGGGEWRWREKASLALKEVGGGVGGEL